MPRQPADRSQDRQILALAVPAFAALVAEPLFLLADSAIVGHLGTLPLAGLGIAAAVLSTVVGLCVFLAYGTTAGVARRLGADDLRGALAMGVDGVWLALGLGLVLWVVTAAAAPWIVTALGASEQVAPPAVAYLRWSLPGVPAMLVVLAATGVLRGLQDTRTPLVVAVSGAVANVALNYVLVYPAGMGIAGSGLGTSLAQIGMAVALVRVVVRAARREGAPLRPDRPGHPRRRPGRGARWSSARSRCARCCSCWPRRPPSRATRSSPGTRSSSRSGSSPRSCSTPSRSPARRSPAASSGPGTSRAPARPPAGWCSGVSGSAPSWACCCWCRRRGSGGCSRPTSPSRPSSPPPSCPPRSPSRCPATCSCSTACSSAPATAATSGSRPPITAAVFVPLAGLVLWVGPGGTAGLVWLWVAFTVGWMGARTVTLWSRERSGRWLVTGASR